MRHSRNRFKRRAVVAAGALVAVLSVSGYAFTASNTVPSATLGQGSSAISGYNVTSVAYGLNATTPTNLDSVTFTITPAAATSVKVQLVASGSWYTCTNSTGTVTCPTLVPQATAATATTLNVVASQ
jgi:hypothetical protein